jgi:hypothetical protein
MTKIARFHEKLYRAKSSLIYGNCNVWPCQKFSQKYKIASMAMFRKIGRENVKCWQHARFDERTLQI